MRVIAYAVAAALLFAGCTQPEPKEPKASSTPTATAPSIPPAAQEDSEAGAIAFVKHYIDVFNYASNTGDVKELKKLSDPQCEGCNSYIETIEKTYSDGGYFKGSDWTLSSVSGKRQGADVVVFAHVKAPGGRYKLSSNDGEKAGEPEDVDVAFVSANSKTRWTLVEFGLQDEDAS